MKVASGVLASAGATLVNTDVDHTITLQVAGVDTSAAGALNLAPTNATSIAIPSTAPIVLGGSAATLGDIRFLQAGSMYQRDGANNRAIWVGASAAQNFGNTATANVYSGLDVTLQSGNGAGFLKITSGGSFTLSNGSMNFSSASGSGSGLLITPTWNGAASGVFGASCTSAKLSQADKTTNGGTGAALTIQAQNETGTTSIGGALNLAPGTGTTTYGQVNVTGPLNLGRFTQAMADAPQTISAANSASNIIITTGANTAVRALTLSTPPTAGNMKLIRNNCTGNGITVQFSSGSATATIPPGTSALIDGDGTNAEIIMSGT